MLRLLAFSLAVYALVAVDSGNVLGQKSDGKTDIVDANAQHYALLAQYKEMVGIVRSAPSGAASGGMLELRVTYSRPVLLPPDPKQPDKDKKDKKDKKDDRNDNALQKQLDHLERELAQLRKSKKNPKNEKQQEAKLAGQIQQMQYRIQAQKVQEQQQKLIQAYRDRMARTKIDTDYIDFELPFTKDAVVRKLQAGIEYDDKGFPKDNPPSPPSPPSGAKALPGYPAKLSDLTNGDAVKIYLVPPSAATVAAVREATGRAVPADRPFIRLVVIINDNPEGATPPKK